MKSCSIKFKIKDYFPKIDTIPFDEYACLFINKDFNEKITLIEKDYNTCKHQINNVNSDLIYKVHLVNIKDYSLIGICEIVIPYSIISQIDTPGTFIKEQQLKLFIDLKTKRKLFGTIVSSGDLYLYIVAEVFVNNQYNYEYKKKKNVLKDKNGFKKDKMKNIFGNNNMTKKNCRIIKTDKDSLRNECKTYTCLKNAAQQNSNNTITNDFYYEPLSQERKERQISKNQSNPVNISTKSTLTIDNNKNLRNQNQKIKKIQTQRKKLTILDLMEQKYQNKKQLNINNKNTNLLNMNFNISKNCSPKEIKILNLENKENIGSNSDKNFFFFSDKQKNHINNYGNILKNVFSPLNANKNLITNDRANYIYKKKSAQKIRTKISENSIFNYNSSSPYAISNFNIREEEKTNSTLKKIKSCSSKKIQIQKNILNNNEYQVNTNININNISDNNFIVSLEEKQKILDLDKIILEKGVSLRNDFQNQLNYSYNQNKNLLENTFDDIYNISNNSNLYNINNAKNIMGNINVRYNRSQKDFHKINKNFKKSSPNVKADLDTSKNNTNNMTPCSSNQNINSFTQEDLKNNILNLLDFYSLLKKKVDVVKKNVNKNKQKLIIKKEKFNHQLKKNNRLTQKIISVESKIILHATINCSLNEQCILPLIKIKKAESNIYQNIFGLTCCDYDIKRFKVKEKNRLFEEQNIMHLLLIIMKNMVEHYGTISHVYNDDINRKKVIQLLLYKYEIIEKKEDNINLHINKDMNDSIYNNKKKYNNFNKSQFSPGQIIDDEFLNKFKIIREVEEDKEYDDSDEEENIKKEIKEKSNLDDIDIENNDNFFNEKVENGASKNENEKSNKKNNQFISTDENHTESNKLDLINKILFDEFPKKYPNENRFIHKNKSEYYFGENIVNVEMNNSNNLEFKINNLKYNLEDFIKFFSKNNKFIDVHETNKEEQINGIESTAVGTEKSENLIRDKNNKSISHNDNDDENNDNYNSIKREKRIKRKISIEDLNENQEYKELNMIKNGADSNSEAKNN